MRSVKTLAVMVAVLALSGAAHAVVIDYRIDFEDYTTSLPDPGGNWNTIPTQTATGVPLTEFTTGLSTGVNLSIVKHVASWASMSPANCWKTANPGPAWLDVNKYAVQDCFRGNWGLHATVTVSGLDTSKAYLVEVVGSYSTDPELCDYSVQGVGQQFNVGVQGYTNGQWMTWLNVVPTGPTGDIALVLGPAGSTNPAINAMRIYLEEAPPPIAEPAMLGLFGLTGLAARRRRRA